MKPVNQTATQVHTDPDNMTYESSLYEWLMFMLQEGLYQSLNEYDRNKDTSVPTSDWSQPSSHVGESSWHGNSDSQIALDEAFARSLLQEEFDELNISQPSRTEIGKTKSSHEPHLS